MVTAQVAILRTSPATVLRDYRGVDLFAAAGAGVAPLYTDDPRQTAFENAEDQFEERWSLDVHLQADIAVIVTQQYAAALSVTAIPVDVVDAA